MRKKLFIPIILLLLFYNLPSIAQQSIFINEVLASNDNIIADNTGDYTDLIELYNSGNSALVLDGYYITNDVTNPTKFRFSGNVQVPAHGYLVLWASDDITRGNTHLPFKVSASGTDLYLYLPDAVTIADFVSLSAQKADVSYGRITDGAASFAFFAKPTPGATNNTSTGYAGIMNAPLFSANAGFYGAPFSLTISSDDANAAIIYTTDGSIPDAGNTSGTAFRYKNKYPQNPGDVTGPFLTETYRSNNYVSPIAINDASTNPNKLCIKSSTYEVSPYYFPTSPVNKGTVVRAVAVKPGYIPSEITTATYFVTSDGKNKYTLPVISLAMPEYQLYSWDSGIYNAGTDFDKWRTDNPTTALFGGGEPANWRRDTEYPLSFELFEANATNLQLQTNTGWTINGNYSRSKPQKAMRIYFRNSYGASDINYPIFPDLPYKNYERLLLSNSGQDMNTTHIRDMTIESSVKHLRFDIMHAQPSITFINGEFWGLLNIRERYDDNYFDQKYGIKSEELDFLENKSTVKNGTNTEINSLRNFFTANDMTVPANYQSVQTRMDLDNFIDYEITEIFFGNNDWPSNNIEYFRKRTAYTPGAPKGQDGRFRFVLCDMDRGLGVTAAGGPTYNSLAWATGTRTDVNPPTWSTDMLRKLLANTDFRTKFITRYADLINTTFLPANINSVINYYRDMVTPHIAEHLQRWRRPSTVSAWNDTVNKMNSYATQRPFYVMQHLRQYFSLSSEQELTIDVSDSAQGFITVNTIDITPAFPGVPKQAYPWKGLYYPEVPVTLIAKAKDGFRFTHWEGDNQSTDDTITVTLSTARSFKAFFEPTAEIDNSKLVHYWHFNNLPTGAVTSVAADSTVTGNALITYEGTGAGYIDATSATEGSALNAQFNTPAGAGLRPRNPAATRALLITAPTTGYKKIALTYATTRTTKGAEYQRVLYTTDGSLWNLKADSIVVASPETTFGLQTFDFSDDPNSTDNPNFAIRIEFLGNNAILTSGNDRFDNIAISGTQLVATPLPPTVSIVSDKNSVCSNSKVTFTATVTDAGSSPSYQWTKNGVNVGNNSNTYFDNFQNKDSVFCILTVDGVSVKSNKVIMTVVPNSMVITSLSKTTVSACKSDGQITINRSGGTSPFTYSLDNINYFASNVFINLAPATYTGYVQDAKGCTATLSDVLTKASPLVITSLSKVAASGCNNDGQITINRSGGTSAYLYSLDNVTYVSSNVFTNLAPGNYTAYVKDARGCAATPFSDVLTRSSGLAITSVTTVGVAACKNDGQLTINRSGGVSPFTYSINNTTYVTSNVFSNLAAGTYTTYVKDAKGCVATRANNVLTKASALAISSVTNVGASACSNNGQLTINRSGGTSPYTYSLNNVSFVSGNVFSNLSAGTYTVYVKDARGCTASRSNNVITKASALVITSVTKTAATACRNDGRLTINRSGGTSPFTYSLNNVTYVTSNVFSNLAAGTYRAYVKDARGCTTSLSNIVLTAAPCNTAARSTVPGSGSTASKLSVSSAQLNIKAYPNPSTQHFSIIAESANSKDVVEIIITDMAGRKLLYTRSAANNVFSFGKELKAGTYIIEAVQGKERATLKIVKGN